VVELQRWESGSLGVRQWLLREQRLQNVRKAEEHLARQIAYCYSLVVEVEHWTEGELRLQQRVYEAGQCLRAGHRGRNSLLWTCRQSSGHCSELVEQVVVAGCTRARRVERESGRDLTGELLASRDLQAR
jgi:hypothetical protein